MKFILLIAMLALYIHANSTKKVLNATIVTKNADLYKAAHEEGRKIINFFKKGDIVNIYYCDTSYKWCKTQSGFIKKEQLKFIVPKRDNNVIVEETISVVKMPIISTEKNATIEKTKKVVDYYGKYFSKETAVVFTEK